MATDREGPRQNHLLAALPPAEWKRWKSHLQAVDMPLGMVLYEAGKTLSHVYFPTNSIVSLLYVMQDGASAEIAVVGNEGLIGVSLGGDELRRCGVVDGAGGRRAGMLKQMWEKLDAYTVTAADGSERNINVRNEWGGFSRRLKMPVFTGWQDHVRSVNGQMRVLVLDRRWNNIAGVNNQEHLVAHALEHDSEAAFFVIKAVDPLKSPRSVEWLDDTRVLCGKVVREGDQAFITATRQVPL